MSKPIIGQHRRAVGKAYIAKTGDGVYYTDSFDSTSPVWGAINTGLASLNLYYLQGDADHQFVLAGTGPDYIIYHRNGGDWTAVATRASFSTLLGVTIDTIQNFSIDPLTPGYIAALLQGGNSFYFAYSTDYGTTWHYYSSSPFGSSSYSGSPPMQLSIGTLKGASAQAAGQVFYALTRRKLFKSLDRGATWAAAQDDSGNPNAWITSGNTLFEVLDGYQDVVYAWDTGNVTYSADGNGLWRSTDQGLTFSRLYSGALYLLSDGPRVSALPPGDGSKAETIRFIGAQNNDGGGNQYIVKSTDAGAHWAQHAFSATGGLINIYVNPLYPDHVFLFGEGGLYTTDDEGATLSNKNGNLPHTIFPFGFPVTGLILP